MARSYVLGPHAARELKRLIRGNGGTSRRGADAEAASTFDSDYAPPFTVTWAQSANDGDGAWIIWLPGDDLVTLANTPIDVADDLEGVGGDYPDGWYLLSSDVLSPSNGGTLYLNATGAASENDTASASFAASVDSDADLSVKICQAVVDSQTGKRMVKQFVTSAIVLANDGVRPESIGVEITRSKADSSGGGAAGATLLTVNVGLEMSDGTVVSDGDTTNLTEALMDAAGNFEISTAEGSGLVLSPENLDGESGEGGEGGEGEGGEGGSTGKVLDLLDRDPNEAFAVHTLTVINDKDGSGEYIHVLSCDDIEIHIPEFPDVESLRGEDGAPGAPGQDGHTPSIYASTNSGVTTIYADGTPIATIHDGQNGQDGHTPVITAETANGVTTIKVDGNTVATIQSGEAIQRTSITCISGIRFQVSNGKLKAIVSKQSFHVPDEFEMHPVETIDAETIDVCDVSDIDVVTSEAYSTSTHKFTNTRKKIKVIGTPADTSGQTPFTATPLSGE